MLVAQRTVLYRSSHIALISFVYALIRSQYILAMVPAAVFATSVRPDSWWTIVVVKCALLAQSWVAQDAQYGAAFYGLTNMGFACYLASLYYYGRDNWRSTYAHVGLHVFANLANIALYSGRVPALEWQRA
jgi:hypothetical protein